MCFFFSSSFQLSHSVNDWLKLLSSCKQENERVCVCASVSQLCVSIDFDCDVDVSWKHVRDANRRSSEALKSITQHECHYETVETEHIKFESMIHVSIPNWARKKNWKKEEEEEEDEQKNHRKRRDFQ